MNRISGAGNQVRQISSPDPVETSAVEDSQPQQTAASNNGVLSKDLSETSSDAELKSKRGELELAGQTIKSALQQQVPENNPQFLALQEATQMESRRISKKPE